MKKILYFFILSGMSFLLIGCPSEKEIIIYGCKNPKATNYDAAASTANNCLCKFDGINKNCVISTPISIFMPPIEQETEVWCWLAVGEMIFKYYGLPAVNTNDYQCGIVAAVNYSSNGACDACNTNCGNCVRPAGSANTLSYMLSIYPKISCKNLFDTGKTLKNSFVSNYLSPTFLISELNSNRPVIAGINPGSQFALPGSSQHVAIIKGYYYDLRGVLILRINDPYPYWTKGVNPFLMNGAVSNGDLSYQIPYVNFVNGLLWNTSWYGIGW